MAPGVFIPCGETYHLPPQLDVFDRPLQVLELFANLKLPLLTAFSTRVHLLAQPTSAHTVDNMEKSSETGRIQILTYIRRKRSLTRAQFYDHWENVHGPKVIPWAEKHGIIRYQQLHVAGFMVPKASSDSAPNAADEDLPTEPVEFDGIAMFLVPSLERFARAFEDPYFVNVIEPDEQEMIDKSGPGKGIVASFEGKMLCMTAGGLNAVGEKGDRCRKTWEEWEAKGKIV